MRVHNTALASVIPPHRSRGTAVYRETAHSGMHEEARCVAAWRLGDSYHATLFLLVIPAGTPNRFPSTITTRKTSRGCTHMRYVPVRSRVQVLRRLTIKEYSYVCTSDGLYASQIILRFRRGCRTSSSSLGTARKQEVAGGEGVTDPHRWRGDGVMRGKEQGQQME